MPQADLEEQFSLKWNDYQSNLSTGFQHLLEEEIMLDVSLSAGGKLIQAHKLILSICSPYFKGLFQANPCKHPVIILKDVGTEELLDVLDFMYRGEANVKKENLAAFLRLAENLKVKGLADNDEDEGREHKETYRRIPVKKKFRSSDSSNSEKTNRHDNDECCGSGPPKKRKKKLMQFSKIGELTTVNNTKEEKKLNESDKSKLETDENIKTDELNQISKSHDKRSSNIIDDSNVDNDNDDDDFGDDNMDDFGAGPSTSDDNGDNLPSDYKRAPIWDYFDENKFEETVMCKICARVFSNKKKWGTANMKRHMKLHPLEYLQFRAAMQREMENRYSANIRFTQLILNQ